MRDAIIAAIQRWTEQGQSVAETSVRQMKADAGGRQSEMASTLLSRAREMIPVLAERAAAAEAQRSIPAQTIAEFKRAGFFRVIQPKRYGGYELDPQIDRKSVV